jgi:glutamate dehydrogenase/leucine dehydrogenase
MSYIIEEIKKLYPDGFKGVRICVNGCTAPARTLVTNLFHLGATVYASDPVLENISILNKVIHELAGSMHRYKHVSFGAIHLEQAEVFVKLNEPTGIINAKHTISPRKPSQ